MTGKVRSRRPRDELVDYEDKPIDDIDNPEWTEEDFALARRFRDVFPAQYEALTRARLHNRRGKIKE